MQAFVAPWVLLLSLMVAAADAGESADGLSNPPESDSESNGDPETGARVMRDRLNDAMSRRFSDAFERLSESIDLPAPPPDCSPQGPCDGPAAPEPERLLPPPRRALRWGQDTVEMEDGRVLTVLTIEGSVDITDTAFGQTFVFAGGFEGDRPAIVEVPSTEPPDRLAVGLTGDSGDLLAACLDPEDPIHFDCR